MSRLSMRWCLRTNALSSRLAPRKATAWGVLFALLAAACGGETEEDADAGGAGGATSDGAGGAGGAAPTPSDDWIEIVGDIPFCIRSRAGRVLCGADKAGHVDLSLWTVDEPVDGISLGAYGGTWAGGSSRFLGVSESEYGYPGYEWLVPPPGPTFGMAMFRGQGYCSFPEPPPAVPECFGLDGTFAFPLGRKFREVAGVWYWPDSVRLIGITEEGTLWCNYLGGDDCHAGFGLAPGEQPVAFDSSTTVVVTDWGRALRHSRPAYVGAAEPESELLQPAGAPDAFLVAALNEGPGFLDREGRLVFLLDAHQNSTFYRTDTGEVEDLTALRFRGVVGHESHFSDSPNGSFQVFLHICGILESGFVNCWSSSTEEMDGAYAPKEALPPP